MRVLWLTGASGMSPNMRQVVGAYWEKAGIARSSVFPMIFPIQIEKANILELKARKLKLNKLTVKAATAELDSLIAKIKPTIIAVNSAEALAIITGQTSLSTCRGSVYFYKDIPCMVVDKLNQLFNPVATQASWIFMQDMQKLGRWARGKQRSQPKFVYKVCHTRADLDEAEKFLNDCILIAQDIETNRGQYISCDGFAGLHPDGRIITYVIPFINPTKPSRCHWEKEEDEIHAWGVVQRVNANKAVKGFQNGSYDNAFLIRHGVPPKHFLTDSMHLMHSMWPESQKKLNFISSILLDYYRYWKDEIKGDNAAQKKVSADAIPETAKGLDFYWRYNALDNYNTLLIIRNMLRLYAVTPWFQYNYHVEFATQFGPNFAMSMRGMLLDTQRQAEKGIALDDEKEAAADVLGAMVDAPIGDAPGDFNPNSPDQVASLIYDVLGANVPQTRKKGKKDNYRPTGEKELERVSEQHPLYKKYVDAIWAYKEPRNNISKYVHKRLTFKDRFMYNINIGNTETWRAASNEHAFWVGTNAQNIPEFIRDMFVADPGYFIFDADYSQSDAVFIAYESEDDSFIANINSGKDTHCIHGAFFFRETYEHFYGEYLAKNPLYSHKVTGFRATTKRVVHGSNFQMAGFTLYMTMGREPVIVAARALGYKDPHKWDVALCVKFCDKLLDMYHQMYPGIRKNLYKRINADLGTTSRVTNGLGMTRIFFGKAKDSGTQREASAYIGQGDTGGNINRALRIIYYGFDPVRSKCPIGENGKPVRSLEDEGLMLLLQVHDSIVGLVPQQKLHLRKKLLTIMEEPLTIRGREFHVPASAAIGLRWGERTDDNPQGCMKWTENTTAKEIWAS